MAKRKGHTWVQGIAACAAGSLRGNSGLVETVVSAAESEPAAMAVQVDATFREQIPFVTVLACLLLASVAA
jgi:hypothetical protein